MRPPGSIASVLAEETAARCTTPLHRSHVAYHHPDMGCFVISLQSRDASPECFAPPPSCTLPPYAARQRWEYFPTERIQRCCLFCKEVGGASLTPQVQFQMLPTTSSSGKGRQSLSVSKLTAVTE